MPFTDSEAIAFTSACDTTELKGTEKSGLRSNLSSGRSKTAKTVIIASGQRILDLEKQVDELKQQLEEGKHDRMKVRCLENQKRRWKAYQKELIENNDKLILEMNERYRLNSYFQDKMWEVVSDTLFGEVSIHTIAKIREQWVPMVGKCLDMPSKKKYIKPEPLDVDKVVHDDDVDAYA